MRPDGGQQGCGSGDIHPVKVGLGITPDSACTVNDRITVRHELRQGGGISEVPLNEGNAQGGEVGGFGAVSDQCTYLKTLL